LRKSDSVQFILIEQQFFATSSGAINVDSRINAAVGDAAVENEFHVARAFEFLENNSSMRLPVSTNAVEIIVSERLLRCYGLRRKSVSVCAMRWRRRRREYLAGMWHDCVVGARQTGD
jgi:hypothetical protein